MNMKKVLAWVLVLMLTAFGGLAEISFKGNVVASEKAAVKSPFGGTVEKLYLRVGDLVEIGDSVARIGTSRVYATAEGKVSGIFGQEGDSAETLTTRYGGVVYIEPTNKYIVTASTEKAYNSSETKYIRVGERVFLSCTQDGSHTGTAVVTSVKVAEDGSGNTNYALEVTGGEFYMAETVGIFRSSKYEAETRIGRGTIGQNAAIAVGGTGSILKMDVEVGDSVERGQVLFETVEGVLDGLYAMDNTIVSDVQGIVATVDAAVGAGATKGGNLITVYARDAFQIKVNVSEFDLASIAEGNKVYIEFEWNNAEIKRYKGQVERISYLNESGENANNVSYAAYIDFTPDETVRLGMSVIVYVVDEWDDEEPEEVTEIEESAEADENKGE